MIQVKLTKYFTKRSAPALKVLGTAISHHQLYDNLPLDGDQFRLVKLQPGQWNDRIVCYLTVHKVAGQLEFEALSYTWGSNGRSEVITVNGASVNIGASLETALRYIRLPHKSRVLWIDALCINQKDDIEKGHQVQKMCQVYSSATTVLAWLGPPHSNGERALSDIRYIDDKMSPVLNNNDEAWDDLQSRPLFHIKRLGLNLEAIDWDAIWDLCNRSFWRRMWILQELALSGDTMDDTSSNRCIVGCGSEWVSFLALSNFYIVFGLLGVRTGDMVESMAKPFDLLLTNGNPAFLIMNRILMFFHTKYKINRGARGLENIMRLSRSLQATDPRDKLYGLLGIVRDYPVEIDYKRDVTEVYKSFVISWIERNGNLNCILGNRVASNDFKPSWLPELSNPLIDGKVFEHLIWMSYDKGEYKMSPQISFVRENNIMKARGILLGRIDRVVGPFWNGTEPKIRMDLVGKLNTNTEYNSLLDLIGRLYLSLPENVQDDVWRACIMDAHSGDGTDFMTPAPDHFRHLWRVFIFDDKIDESFEPHLEQDERRLKYLLPFTESLGIFLGTDRCFFVTENLRMGLGPCSVRAGDEAVVLFGSPLPLALRPAEQGYTFVGDAYVQGVDPFNFPPTENGERLPVQDFMIH
ncbi:hypothetical protein FPOAC2_04360 [Fusarium poae]|uniref:hypothetical protein n=1 Tax=Fusarium poae TaxID=36050 RepID=UPI001CE817D6|nr:hypothetical protein FPOAC1_004281 [Fusarium poae]KAG8671044.1 hypothetical protein FPOAC1_004281 [Fusarium poae]